MPLDRAALREKLETALTRVVTELAEGDIKPDYSINGQSVQWTQYRQHLLEETERLQGLLDTIGEDDGGIAWEQTQAYT